MYNAELKRKFLSEHTEAAAYERLCLTVFKQTEPFEIACDCDLSAMSIDKLQDMVNAITGVRGASGSARIRVLKRYVEWCKNNQIDGVTDNIFNITLSTIEAIKRKMVSGPSDLQKYLDSVFEPAEKEFMSIIYRGFFWLGFSGINERDLFRITAKNIIFDEGIILLDGKRYPLYHESLPVISRLCKLVSFNYYQTEDNNYRQHRRNRYSGSESILRGFRSESDYKKMAYQVMLATKRAADKNNTPLRLNYPNANLSGFFYHQRQKELALREPLSSKDFAKGIWSYSKDNISAKEAKNLFNDYENWKEAFGV